MVRVLDLGVFKVAMVDSPNNNVAETDLERIVFATSSMLTGGVARARRRRSTSNEEFANITHIVRLVLEKNDHGLPKKCDSESFWEHLFDMSSFFWMYEDESKKRDSQPDLGLLEDRIMIARDSAVAKSKILPEEIS